MAAATFYSAAAPSPTAGYPVYLPATIVTVAVVVCVLCNALLAHAALTARNRMAEMILTKRRLWRIMAEKEAAEQAIELKQQFISVASHEVSVLEGVGVGWDGMGLMGLVDPDAVAYCQWVL